MTEHWGGWTDGIIEHWHRLIGSFGFERGSYPRDRVNLALIDEKTGRGVLINSSRFAVGDVVTRTQLLLVEGGVSEVTPDRARAALSMRFDLKVPVGSPSRLGGSGGWDVGLAMIGTVEMARWVTLHALVGVAYFSAIALPEPLQPVPWHLTVELSLPFRVGPITLLLEDRVTSTLFQGGWRLPPKTTDADVLSSGYYGAFRPQNQVSGGIRWGPVTWWFSEDWTPGSNPHSDRGWFYNSNTPDIATGLTVSLML